MGNTFANIQVYTGDRDKTEIRADIMATVQTWLLGEKFVETDDEQETDRHIIVTAPSSEPWITVYDEGGEQFEPLVDSYDKHETARIARALSSTLNTTALGVQLFDNILQLFLYRNGRVVDVYSTEPIYFDVQYRRGQEFTGRPKRWEYLLKEGVTPDDLQTVWQDDYPNAMDQLASISNLLNLHPGRCFGSFFDIDEEIEPGLAQLSFHLNEPPLYERQLNGLPVFECRGGSSNIRREAGTPLIVSVYLENRGGPSKGVKVNVWGEALNSKLVEIEKIQIVSAGKIVDFVPKLEKQVHSIVLTGQDAEINIPVGVIIPPIKNKVSDAQLSRIYDARDSATVRVNLEGKALSRGKSILYIGAIPLENPTSLLPIWTLDVIIT